MKVEVLYVAECPSHPAAVKLVRNVLAAEGITANDSRSSCQRRRDGWQAQVPRLPNYSDQWP
jgi:hypothetical protein